MKDLLVNDRPRERLVNKGVTALSNEELITIILGSGVIDVSVKELSNLILKQFDNIRDMNDINFEKLLKIRGIGVAKACQLLASVELGKRVNSKYENIKEIKFKSANDIYEYYKYLYNKKQEHFFCVYLDNKNKIIKEKLLYIGIINGSLIHPRDIYKEAYLNNAVSIICVHNHPSGDITPSKNDIEITKVLKESGLFLGINFLDHIIVGNENYFSFSENNML